MIFSFSTGRRDPQHGGLSPFWAWKSAASRCGDGAVCLSPLADEKHAQRVGAAVVADGASGLRFQKFLEVALLAAGGAHGVQRGLGAGGPGDEGALAVDVLAAMQAVVGVLAQHLFIGA